MRKRVSQFRARYSIIGTAMCVSVLWPILAIGQQPRLGSASEVFRHAKDSVVLILGSKENAVVQGSGFVVAKDKVVTNFHVVDGLQEAYVKFTDGTVEKVIEVTQEDPDVDLAVIQVPTKMRPPLTLGDELGMHEGDAVLALGAPKGLELSLTNGIVSAFRRNGNTFLIQTTTPIAPGSSGGPLLNSAGHVIGVTTFRLKDDPGIYFSVAISELKRMLRTATRVRGVGEYVALDQFRKEIEAGQLRSAKDRANVLLAVNPSNAEGLALSGMIALAENRADDATESLSRAAAAAPASAAIQSLFASALMRTGDFKRGLVHAQQAEHLESTEFTEQTLAVAFYELSDLPSAKQAAQNALVFNEENETALEVMTGAAYFEDPGGPNWLAPAKRLRKIHPTASWGLILDWYDTTKTDNNTALQKLNAAKAAKFPNDLPYMILVGRNLLAPTGADFNAAAKEIAAGLIAIPQNSRLLQAAVAVDLLQHDFDAAAQHLSTLEDTTADVSKIDEVACLYYYARNRAKTALKYCKKSTEATPQDYAAHSNYGWAALNAGEYPLALQEFSTARALIETGGKRGLEMIDLGWGVVLSNWWNGNEAEAKRAFDVLIQTWPEYKGVSDLKKLPIVWSDDSLSKIQGAIDHWGKK